MICEAALSQVLDVLCPMHVILGPSGHIESTGRTFAKLRPEREVTGIRFLELLQLHRPHGIETIDALRTYTGQKLQLQFRDAPHTRLKGVLLTLPEGRLLIDLSFGFSAVEAVTQYQLSSGDFAATDLTIEMLYLVEAKSAAMEASRQLNMRLQGARIAAEEQAYTDTLTGLKNRRALDHILARYLQTGLPFALMQLDLDYFKSVNDTMGHAAGDAVLQSVAQSLVDETRKVDTVARVGGDEFILIFHDMLDPDQLVQVAQRIIERLEKPIPFQGQRCKISGSAGFTISSFYDQPDAARLLADSDAALYAAKHAGRGCVRSFALDQASMPSNP